MNPDRNELYRRHSIRTKAEHQIGDEVLTTTKPVVHQIGVCESVKKSVHNTLPLLKEKTTDNYQSYDFV